MAEAHGASSEAVSIPLFFGVTNELVPRKCIADRYLGQSVAAQKRISHLESGEYGQESHENDDEKQDEEWHCERAVGRLNVSGPIWRLKKGSSREKEKHEHNRHQRADYHHCCGWSVQQREHRGDCYGGE